MKQTNHYLLQTDDNYAKHLLVTVLSVQKHTPSEYHNVFYVIDDHIGTDTRAFMDRFAQRFGLELRFLDASQIVSTLEEKNVPKWRGGYTTYLKLFALNKIEGVERVMYLDSDMIIQSDMSAVFAELDDTDATLGMAEDMTISFRFDYKKYILQTDDKSVPYYNAGSILFDLPRWKKNRGEERVLEFIQTNTTPLMYCEQDILNVVFRNEIKQISNTYNFCTPMLFFKPKLMGKLFYWDQEHTDTYAALEKNYCVGHCFGVFAQRPWHKDSLHPLAADYVALYEEIYEKSFDGAAAPSGTMEKLQYILYRVCRPLYGVMHRIFTNRVYASFIKNATK